MFEYYNWRFVMPSLDQVDIAQEPQSVLVYGAPKAGKTRLVGELSEFFNLHWLDCENGYATLKKLPVDWQKRIDLHRIYDNKLNPNAIRTIMKALSGDKLTICDKHGRVGCLDCKRNRESTNSELHFNTLDPTKDIVVVDSLTQLTSSAAAHAGRDLKEDAKFEFDHWRMQGVYLEKVLDFCQNAQFNVVVITHELGIDKKEGREKIIPAGGTKNFSRNVAKYFGHIVFCDVVNRKHTRVSSTIENARITAGSRTDIDMSDAKTKLADIFLGTDSQSHESSSSNTAKSRLEQMRNRKT